MLKYQVKYQELSSEVKRYRMTENKTSHFKILHVSDKKGQKTR